MESSSINESTTSKNDKYQALERFEIWMQLTNAVNLRSSQDQVLWSIFGTFWAANAILLVALFTNGDLPTNPIVGIVVSAIGMSLSLMWYAIQCRALGHLMRHEALMSQLERKLGFDPSYAVSADINAEAYKQYLSRGPRARKVMSTCSLAAAFLWTSGGVYFALRV